MKTIKQIADEIGVSKQVVYKRYKGRLKEQLLPYAHTVNGTVYIEEQGETLLKSDFEGIPVSGGAHTGAHPYAHTDTPSINSTTRTTKHGEALIQSKFESSETSEDVHTYAHTGVPADTPLYTVIEMLKNELKVKNRQLETKDLQISEKDKQIADLTETVKMQAQSINVAHHNELAETLGRQLLDSGNKSDPADEIVAPPPKRSFFGIFSKKKQCN